MKKSSGFVLPHIEAPHDQLTHNQMRKLSKFKDLYCDSDCKTKIVHDALLDKYYICDVLPSHYLFEFSVKADPTNDDLPAGNAFDSLVHIVCRLNHANILRCVGYDRMLWDSGFGLSRCKIFYECPHSDVVLFSDYINNKIAAREDYFNDVVVKLMKVAEAMEYMHAKNVIMGCVDLDNVYIFNGKDVKVAHIGYCYSIASFFYDANCREMLNRAYRVCFEHPPRYYNFKHEENHPNANELSEEAPPNEHSDSEEDCENKYEASSYVKFSMKNDVYSFGAMAMLALVNPSLFSHRDSYYMCAEVQQERMANIVSHIRNANIQKILLKCVAPEEWQRPTISEVLEMWQGFDIVETPIAQRFSISDVINKQAKYCSFELLHESQFSTLYAARVDDDRFLIEVPHKHFKDYAEDKRKLLLETLEAQKDLAINNFPAIAHITPKKIFRQCGSPSIIRYAPPITPLSECGQSFSEKEIYKVLRDIAGCINHLRIAGIHRICLRLDSIYVHIKPSIIKQDEREVTAYLMNVGYVNVVTSINDMRKVVDISIYDSIEYLIKNIYTHDSEIYAFGTLAYVLLTEYVQRPSEQSVSNAELITSLNCYHIVKRLHEQGCLVKQFPEFMHSDVVKLIQRCWNESSWHRPAWEEVIRTLESLLN